MNGERILRLNILATILLTVVLAGCAAIKPGDPDYAFYKGCNGSSNGITALWVSDEERSCMEQLRVQELRRLEREQQKQRAEQERIAKQNTERAKRDTEAEEERKRAIAECGDDYGKILVGMPLERVKQCWGKFGWFRLTGELSREDGVVSVYEIPGIYGDLSFVTGVSVIYVMQGKIVGWTR